MKVDSLAQRLAASHLRLGLFLLLVTGAASYFFFNQYRNQIIKERAEVIASAIESALTEDILIGAWTNVNYKLTTYSNSLKSTQGCFSIIDSNQKMITRVGERSVCESNSDKVSVVKKDIFFSGDNKGHLAFRLEFKFDPAGQGLALKPWDVLLYLVVVALILLASVFFIAKDGVKYFKTISAAYSAEPIDPALAQTKEILEALRLRESLNKAQEELIAKSKIEGKQAALANIATQVAHDIRSPLSALDMMLASVENLPEDRRILFRNAIGRIKDIANNLVFKARTTDPIAKNAPNGAQSQKQLNDSLGYSEQPRVELLSFLIEQIISEKRLQYRSSLGLDIDSFISNEAYGSFSKVAASQLSRVLSNLINNSFEALTEGRGRIRVELERSNDSISINVVDNGCGISPPILPKLGQMGASFGKGSHLESGSGVGLYHARTMVESWGGTFQIRSKVGSGTTVTLSFPSSPTPHWFAQNLKIVSNATVVILDDDQSIHGIWRERFQSLEPASRSLKILHFATHADTDLYVSKSSESEKSIYLFDHELIGETKSGLDLIEDRNLGSRAILVTSRFEEPEIRERCKRLGVKMIPKSMAAFVPIELLPTVAPNAAKQVQVDVVLIDDDSLIREVWKISARASNKTLNTFASADEFFLVAEGFHGDTPIYVDQNLGNGVKGTDIIRQLEVLNFKSIFLATGEEALEFEKFAGIKVVGKDPPF